MYVFFSFDLRLKFLRCVKISWTQDLRYAFTEEIKVLLRVIIFSLILNKKYLRNVPSFIIVRTRLPLWQKSLSVVM